MVYNDLVASKIREARRELRLSAEYVASELGLAKGSYSNLENGKTEITVNKIETLSRILNKPIASFLPNSNSITQISNGEGNNINYNYISNYYNDPNLLETIQTTIELLQKTMEKYK